MQIDRKTELDDVRAKHLSDEVRHLKSLIDISSKWFYWEMDEHFRYTHVSGSIIEKADIDPRIYVGKRPWDLELTPLGDNGSWDAHKARYLSHQPFNDLLFEYINPHGDVRYINANGQPVFDDDGAFRGYRGISKDITERYWIERRRAIDQRVAFILAESSRIAPATSAVIQAVCEPLGWSGGMRWELDEQSNTFHCRETWGIDDEAITAVLDKMRGISFGADDSRSAARRVCEQRSPLWITGAGDVAELPGKSTAERAGIRGVFAFPLQVGGRPAGALVCFARRSQKPGEEVFKCAIAIGTSLGQFYERKRSEEELRRFRAAMDMSADPIYLVDRTTMRFIDVNQTACRVMGYSREELLNMGPQDMLRRDRAEIERAYDEVIAAGATHTRIGESKVRTKDGRWGVAESHWRALWSEDRWIIVNIVRDVTARKQAERHARRVSRMYAALSATNEAILRASSPEELYQQVCDAAVHGGKFVTAAVLVPSPTSDWTKVAAVTGSGERYLRDLRFSFLAELPEGQGIVGEAFRTGKTCIKDDYRNDPEAAAWNSGPYETRVAAGAAVPLYRGRAPVGVLLFFSEEKHAFDDEVLNLLERMAENIAYALVNFEREAERKRAEERIEYLATHDALTGLPNRVMFNNLLNHAIQTATRYHRKFAVLFIDLDRFKVINDTLGHGSGDTLLQEMASRLAGCLRSSDIVARLGGDEFILLVHDVGDAQQIAAVAQKLLSAITQPIVVLGQECRVTGSIGIAMYPSDGESEQLLMKNADIAMYVAKSEGKNNYRFYSHQRAQSHDRLSFETKLRHALETNELSLHYQAKVDLKTNAITGVEALLRWNNAELGNIPPAQFIPLAEETGLIVPIGKWILKRACADNLAWQRQGLAPIITAVNLSIRQIGDEDLLADIRSALAESGIAPQLLELEITEGMVMQNAERAVRMLNEVASLGVRLAIDDFGTGYSSLAQIKRFPLDTLKIDRSFICNLPDDPEDKAITEAIIAMAKSLGLTVVAEGVETRAQVDFLRRHGCDEMQGYYFSKPLDAQGFAELLRRHAAARPRIRRATR